MHSQTEDPSIRRLRRFGSLLLGMIVATYAWLTYWEYSKEFHGSPAEWDNLLAGRGPAPAQYRIGVLFPANTITRVLHGHLALRYSLTLLDGLFLITGGVVILRLLVTSTYFRRESAPGRYAALFLAILLLLHYLTWATFWYHKPETLANFCCLAAAGILLSGSTRLPGVLSCILLVFIAGYLGTTRADSGAALMAGIFLASLLPGNQKLPFGRAQMMATSMAGLVAVTAVEFYISHILYPHRAFSDPLFQFIKNIESPIDLFCIAASLLPYFLVVLLARRHWGKLEFWERALLVGSVIELAIFMVVAIAQEVRLFIPYAMALIPTSVALLGHELFGEAAASGQFNRGGAEDEGPTDAGRVA